MQKISRRRLAKYAADQLSAGTSAKDLASRLGAVLVATKRADQAGQLTEDIAYELEARGLHTQATLTVAHSLSDQLKQELTKFIAGATGAKDVAVEEVIDSSVIGGVRIDTAGRSWDQTIKRRLTDIREAF
jgi:F0F1-type ATP synthase delta subunit